MQTSTYPAVSAPFGAALRRQRHGANDVARTPPPAEAAARTAGAASDASIRAQLLAGLALQPGWEPGTSNVYVEDGVVIFQGLFRRQADRLAACAAARRLPGVRAVRDDRRRAREWQAMA